MLVLGGLGQKIEDIPIGVIEYLKKSDFVFVESYTNLPNLEILEYLKSIRKDIKEVYRPFVEQELEKFLLENKDKITLLLVYGNPMFATTHISLIEFCKEKDIEVKIIGGASVLDYIPLTGLSIYKFGKIVSIPFHGTETPYHVIEENKKLGMHTLILLDIDPPNNRYLTVNEALIKLLELEYKFNHKLLDLNTKVIICEKLGTNNQKIYYTTIKKALDYTYNYPACIIFPGNLNRIEKELLEKTSIKL